MIFLQTDPYDMDRSLCYFLRHTFLKIKLLYYFPGNTAEGARDAKPSQE